jgi:hypothetical protein
MWWWPALKFAAKAIIGLSALGAAIVALIAWLPLANDRLHPELKEYEALRALYAGASVSLFDGKLGPPSIVKAVPGEPGITKRIYVKEDYVEETVATQEGQAQLYSVLSCNQEFKPSFEFLKKAQWPCRTSRWPNLSHLAANLSISTTSCVRPGGARCSTSRL